MQSAVIFLQGTVSHLCYSVRMPWGIHRGLNTARPPLHPHRLWSNHLEYGLVLWQGIPGHEAFRPVPKCAPNRMLWKPQSNVGTGDTFQEASVANIQPLLWCQSSAFLAKPHVQGKCCPSKVMPLASKNEWMNSFSFLPKADTEMVLKQRQILYINTCVWNLEKSSWWA